MPRPNSLNDLVHLDDAPDFRVGGWWDVFQEARVFYPGGFGAAMNAAQLISAKPIAAKITEAQDAIAAQTDWPKRFKTRHWLRNAPAQAAHAVNCQPMLLTKIAVCFEALQQAINSDPDLVQIDVYDFVYIIPGCYKVDGFDKRFIESNPDSIDAVARRIAADFDLTQTSRIVHDMASGHHVTHKIAECAFDELGRPQELTVRAAIRPGQSGVKAASSWLKFLD